MHIKLKVFATLRDHLQASTGNKSEIDLDFDEEVTVLHVIEHHKLPKDMIHLALINGVYVAPDDLATSKLKEGDVLALWPPIAGG